MQFSYHSYHSDTGSSNSLDSLNDECTEYTYREYALGKYNDNETSTESIQSTIMSSSAPSGTYHINNPTQKRHTNKNEPVFLSKDLYPSLGLNLGAYSVANSPMEEKESFNEDSMTEEERCQMDQLSKYDRILDELSEAYESMHVSDTACSMLISESKNYSTSIESHNRHSLDNAFMQSLICYQRQYMMLVKQPIPNHLCDSKSQSKGASNELIIEDDIVDEIDDNNSTSENRKSISTPFSSTSSLMKLQSSEELRGSIFIVINDIDLHVLMNVMVHINMACLKELTVESEHLNYKDIQKQNRDLFIKKNRDYGNSFQDFGVIGILIRINDKINRLRSLTNKRAEDMQIKTESLMDTVNDLYNYTIMALLFR